MKSITAFKPLEEILKSLGKAKNVYIAGCGTCPAMMKTGGLAEVLAMRDQLETNGKKVTGHTVIPVACEPLSYEARKQLAAGLAKAEAVLVMSCSYGIITVGDYTDLPVLPALNTLFTGREGEPGLFIEECRQCGDCVLGRTGGICPVTRCAKSLFNGPCGGSVAGKCEIDPKIPCAWQQIHDRLKALGRMDLLYEIEPIKDWSSSWEGGPRRVEIPPQELGMKTG